MTLAYHFVSSTLRDGRSIPKIGQKLVHPGRPRMCHEGLHASLDPFDALQYAPGSNLCLVRCEGTIIHGDDKLVCTERTILKMIDATDLLRYFARMQALSVAHFWNPSQLVLDWLMTGDESLRAVAAAAADAHTAAHATTHATTATSTAIDAAVVAVDVVAVAVCAVVHAAANAHATATTAVDTTATTARTAATTAADARAAAAAAARADSRSMFNTLASEAFE